MNSAKHIAPSVHHLRLFSVSTGTYASSLSSDAASTRRSEPRICSSSVPEAPRTTARSDPTNVGQPIDQLAAVVGERHPHDPPVALVALAADVPGALEPVDDTGHRRREHVAVAAEVAGRRSGRRRLQHVQRHRLRHRHALRLERAAGSPASPGAATSSPQPSDLCGELSLLRHRSCSHRSRRILSKIKTFRTRNIATRTRSRKFLGEPSGPGRLLDALGGRGDLLGHLGDVAVRVPDLALAVGTVAVLEDPVDPGELVGAAQLAGDRAQLADAGAWRACARPSSRACPRRGPSAARRGRSAARATCSRPGACGGTRAPGRRRSGRAGASPGTAT